MTLLIVSALVSTLAAPTPPLTPGAVRSLTKEQVCSTKWGTDRRHVSNPMRVHVFAAYGIPLTDRSRFEVDHLVPRSLGGADDILNLWPQPYEGVWNARQKDQLEVKLGKLVCAGTLSLRIAQQAIRRDWIAAYQRYVVAAPSTRSRR
jgi:hypothetical protein